jgi:hypothetical protein
LGLRPAARRRFSEEGAVGGERCGTVVATDLSGIEATGSELPSGVEYINDEIDTGNGDIPGDSGGTEYENSIFGPLVTGTNVSQNGTDVFGEDIDALLYAYSAYYGSAVVVNTVSNP